MALNPQSKRLLLKLAEGGAELAADTYPAIWMQGRDNVDVPHQALAVLLKRGLAVQSLTLTDAGRKLARQFERDGERGADPVTVEALETVTASLFSDVP